MEARYSHEQIDSVQLIPTGPVQADSTYKHRDYTSHCWQAANNPRTTPTHLETLAQSGNPALMEQVALHPNVSPVTLAKMAVFPVTEVRIAVAENANAPLETLWLLAADQNPDVRYALAENHYTPARILESLTNDDNPYVFCRARRTLDRLRNDVFPGGNIRFMEKIDCRPEQAQSTDVPGQSAVNQFCALIGRLYRSGRAACY